MASASSETAFSYTKEYKVGAGTSDQGRDYEFKMVALISLRCLLQHFDDFSIAFNAADLGALDDVVVNARRKDGDNIKILMQLKHEEKGKDIVSEQFLADKGNYSVLKYYNHIVKLKKDLLDCKPEHTGNIKDLGTADNMYFVLFTNKGTQPCAFLANGGCDAISFLNTSENNNKLYRFDLTKVSTEVSTKDSTKGSAQISTLASLPNLDCSINFCLFAKQRHANHLDELIEVELKRVIHHFELTDVNIQNVSKMFIVYVTDWAMGKLGNRYYLTKQAILYKLTELLLCQYELDFSREQLDFYDCPQKLLWNEVVQDKIFTVIDSDEGVIKFMKQYLGSEIRSYYEISGKLWNDKFSVEEQNLFYKLHPNLKKAMLKIVGNNGKITLLSLYKCLWFSEHLPLLLKIKTLESYDNILKILKLSNCKLKVIILNATTLMPTKISGTPGYFTTLSDLNNEHRIKILNNPVKLQGGRVVLKELIDDSLFLHINCKVIIDILSGNFNIGIEYEPISEYFIKRSLFKIFIKIDVLEKIKDETFVIEINQETEDTRNKLNTVISRYKTKTHIIVDGDIPKQIEELKNRKSPIHRFVFRDENLLEWKESFGSTNQIRRYQFSHAKWLCSELEDILTRNNATKFFNEVNLVSASPGMGKSTLLDYVASTASTKMWVLNVKLLDYADHYDNIKSREKILTAQDHLKYFNDSILEKRNCTNIELARGVFEKFVSAKQVLVMLDGFDEVSVSCKNEVIEITKCLHEAGFPLWLTTRPHLKTDLEEEFATISTTLKPFSVDDQKSFLNRYFKHIGDTVDDNKENHQTLTEEFVKKLLQASRDNLNDTEGEFMGIPLQTKLLANAFSKELKRSLSRGIAQFEGRFDLVHLYEEFMKGKDNILRDKLGEGVKETRIVFQELQQLLALELVFSDYNLYRLEIDRQMNEYYKNNEDQIKFLQQDGVTVIQRNFTGTGQKFQVSFVHRTFAEYMAALWLFNNFNSERDEYRWTARFLLKKRKLSFKYGLLFRMFDSMLAIGSRLHMLIINGRLDEAQKLVKSNPEVMNETDAGGRSFLHMLALYRIFYVKRRSKVKNRMTHFLGEITKYTIINMKDKLGYSPLDYAMLNKSFAYTHRKYGISKETSIARNILDLRNIYTSCRINLNYEALIKPYLPLIICQELLVNSYSVNHDTTIASYCCTLFENNRKIDAIIKNYTKELDITTISELLISIGIKSAYVNNAATEPPYYYDLRFAAAFGTSRNVRNLISSESAAINQDNLNNLCTPLYWAVKYNRLKIVKILLLRRKNDNECDTWTEGETPLHCAAANGYTKIAKQLLLNQADVNVQNHFGETPLILALKNKHAHTAKLLLSSNANINVKDILDRFPIYYAAESGLDDIIPDLIKGVDINHPSIDDNTPLDVAISNGQLSTVRLLLRNDANCNTPNSEKKLPLHTAASSGSRKIFANIFSKTVDNDGISSNYVATDNSTCVKDEAVNTTNKKGRVPLHLRIYRKWTDFNKRPKDNFNTSNFLEFNIQDLHGDTKLHNLCRDGSIDGNDGAREVTLFLNKGADVNLKNTDGQTPVHVLLRNLSSGYNYSKHYSKIVSLLCNEDNVNIQDNYGNTPLHYLCSNCRLGEGDVEGLVELLNKGAVVNLKNNDGETHVHALLNNPFSEYNSKHLSKIISVLCNEDNVNIQDNYGNTPLHYLCSNCRLSEGDVERLVELLNKGAVVNLKNNDGETPVHVLLSNLFSEYNSKHLSKIISVLCNEDNVNIQDDYGNTPLHYLFSNFRFDEGDVKSVVELLNKGAVANLKNNDGETPVHALLNNQSSEYNPKYLYKTVSLRFNKDNLTFQDDCGAPALYYLCEKRQLGEENNDGEIPVHALLYRLSLEYNSKLFSKITPLLFNEDNVNIQDNYGDTALHYLCDKRRLGEGAEGSVVELLNKGADVNLKRNDGKTPVHALLNNKSSEYNSKHLSKMVSLLCNEDNVNIQDNYGNTPLHYLCSNCRLGEGDVESVVELLNKGAVVNLKNNDGETPVRALLNNPSSEYISIHLSKIISLLCNEDNVNIQDNCGNTPLHYLCGKCLRLGEGDVEIVVEMLKKGAVVNLKNNKGGTPIHALLNRLSSEYISKHLSKMISLLCNEDNVNIQDNYGNTPLHYLCSNCRLGEGDVESVVEMLNKGAVVNLKNNDGETPVRALLNNLSSEYNPKHLYKTVSLRFNKDNLTFQDDCGAPALYYLREKRRLGEENNDDEIPVHALLYYLSLEYNSKHLSKITSLLFNEDNVNIQDNYGDTALHYLCEKRRLGEGAEESVVELLNKGADVNLKDYLGRTPVHVLLNNASSEYNPKHLSKFVSLLSSENNVNIQDTYGNTPLHCLCDAPWIRQYGVKYVIELLNKGADINLKNNDGETPLVVLKKHIAPKYISTHLSEIVSLLSS